MHATATLDGLQVSSSRLFFRVDTSADVAPQGAYGQALMWKKIRHRHLRLRSFDPPSNFEDFTERRSSAPCSRRLARRPSHRLNSMSISIPAHEALGVEAKEYSIVNGCIQNVRLWPGKDGRTYFGLRSDTGSGSAETIDEFMLRVPRDVAALRVRSPRPQTALA